MLQGEDAQQGQIDERRGRRGADGAGVQGLGDHDLLDEADRVEQRRYARKISGGAVERRGDGLHGRLHG